MAIPKYDEMYDDFLHAISDGNEYKISDVREKIAQKRQLTAEERTKRLPSNAGIMFNNRVSWTKTYLLKAGLLCSERRGYCRITEDGKKLLSEKLDRIDNTVLERYKSFQEYIRSAKKNNSEQESVQPYAEKEKQNHSTDILDDAPNELIAKAVEKLNAELADELLNEIMEQTPGFFEWMVSHLLEKMGYGVSELELSKTNHQSRDGGIDGIIRQDKLGFDKIYIQAKRWDVNTADSRPELQKFYGALPNSVAHGLFITTARFSDDAKKYAESRENIVLVDGMQLAKLMIEHNVGVSVETQYVIKRLDTDFFRDE